MQLGLTNSTALPGCGSRDTLPAVVCPSAGLTSIWLSSIFRLTTAYWSVTVGIQLDLHMNPIASPAQHLQLALLLPWVFDKTGKSHFPDVQGWMMSEDSEYNIFAMWFGQPVFVTALQALLGFALMC